MEMEIIGNILGIITVLVIVGFAALRAIDHAFWVAEHKREVRDDQNMMVGYANIEYRHQKRLIQEKGLMAETIVKEINDGVLENAKQFYKDLEDWGK